MQWNPKAAGELTMKLKVKLLDVKKLEDGEIEGIAGERVISILHPTGHKHIFVFYMAD